MSLDLTNRLFNWEDWISFGIRCIPRTVKIVSNSFQAERQASNFAKNGLVLSGGSMKNMAGHHFGKVGFQFMQLSEDLRTQKRPRCVMVPPGLLGNDESYKPFVYSLQAFRTISQPVQSLWFHSGMSEN